MGTCPSKPGGVVVVPKTNAVQRVNRVPKMNSVPKTNNRNRSDKTNNRELSEIEKLEKRLKEIEGKIMSALQDAQYSMGAQQNIANYEEEKKQIEKKIEELKNPQPSAPELPNAPAPSEDPQAGGKRRCRTMKRKSRRRRQPKRKHSTSPQMNT